MIRNMLKLFRENPCLGCYTLIFSVMFLLFGLCVEGFWHTARKIDTVNINITALSCAISAHTGIPVIKQ